MKILILPLLAAALGAGWYGLSAAATATPASAGETTTCQATVECTPRGTCVVTCRDAGGAIVCQREIECDEPCASPCTPGPGACGTK